ncbi:hypothetical protein L7F22_051747 [Adiantum nelumboides]|nr:hypothetical protein [Adiantum nelumboides]
MAYPIRKKDMVFDVFKQWVTLVENQTGCKLKCLRTYNGGEFMSHAFSNLCVEKGTPYTPPQNGVVEHMNRTIQEKVCSMLSMAGLSDAFWVEAVATSMHLINRSPSVPLGFKVHEEVCTGLPPSYGHLRVFDCKAYVHVPKVFYYPMHGDTNWKYVIDVAPRATRVLQSTQELSTIDDVNRILDDNDDDTSEEGGSFSDAKLEYSSTSTDGSASEPENSFLNAFELDTNTDEIDTFSHSSIGLNLEIVLEIDHEDLYADITSVL